VVTRDDVAKAAGVSPAVVSYVVNNGPRPVAAATRERVLEVIAELGYQRDGLARAFRRGRSDTIGLVVPDVANPFFAELSRLVEAEARNHSRMLLVGTAGEDDDALRSYVLQLTERRVDGLLVVSTVGRSLVQPLVALDIPVVALDRPQDDTPVSTIRIDNVAAADEATRHLLQHGHPEVCLINGPERSGVAVARREGWLRALGGRSAPHTVADYTARGGAEAMRQLLERAGPTAVLVASDVQAIGVERTILDAGLRCPEDIAVVSFDGTEAAAYAPVPLTCVSQPIGDMASKAVAHLLDPGRVPLHLVLDHGFVRRRSCGCLGPVREGTPREAMSASQA
jgi:LacI family transcriptional regulator